MAIDEDPLQRIDNCFRLAQSRAGQFAVQLDRGNSLPGTGKGDNFGGHTALKLRRRECDARSGA